MELEVEPCLMRWLVFILALVQTDETCRDFRIHFFFLFIFYRKCGDFWVGLASCQLMLPLFCHDACSHESTETFLTKQLDFD